MKLNAKRPILRRVNTKKYIYRRIDGAALERAGLSEFTYMYYDLSFIKTSNGDC